MALGIDREKFRTMVNYFRANVGGILSVSPVAPGELKQNKAGEWVLVIQGTRDKEEFFALVYHYLERYNSYPDEPLVEFDNEKKYLYILDPVDPSFNPKIPKE